MKLSVLKILDENKNNYISGEKIAMILGISRNAIWKHIKTLKSEGYSINSKNNLGYSLIDNDLISKYLISKLLTSDFIKKIVTLETCISTNNYLKKLTMNDIQEGTLVVSNLQTNGKGRQGRNFCSPKDVGLYFSLLLTPCKIDCITAYIATIVSSAIDKLYKVETKIKWVNDIYLNNKKICGILTEGHIEVESGLPTYLIVGIGINVNNTNFTKEISNIASSLFIETGIKINRLLLLAEILNNINNYKMEIENLAFLETYIKKMFLMNLRIKFIRNNEIFYGKVIGVDNDCSLIVLNDNSDIIHLNSGEVHIIAD